MSWRVLPVLLLLTLWTSRVDAHGGEDHDDHEEASHSTASMQAASGSGDVYEVLVRAPSLAAGEPLSLTVFVANAETNEPLALGEVELEFSGPETVKLRPDRAKPGIWLAHVTLAVPGQHALLATVTHGDAIDLVTLSDWTVPTATGESTGGKGARRWMLAVGLLLVLAIVVVLLRARKPPKAAQVAAILLTLAPGFALAHGGEVHPGEETQSGHAGAGGVILYPKESQFLLGVRTEVVRTAEFQARTLLPGRVLSRNNGTADVHSPIAGRLDPTVRLPIPGERVEKGQLIAVVEQSFGGEQRLSLTTDRIRLQAQLRQAESEVRLAQAEVARMERLSGVVAEKEVLEARNRLTTAQENRNASARALDLFGQGTATAGNYAKTKLVAPIGGTIAEVRVGLGQQVETQEKLFTIVDVTSVWVEASLFANDLSRVGRIGTALMRVDAFPGRWFEGRVLSLSPVVDPQTQALRVTFVVQNPDGLLRPGMFAEVAVADGEAAEAVVVSDSAVIESEGRRFVFVKTGPESFVVREVRLRARDGALWAVEEGVEAGEKVVVSGTYQLRSARGGL